MKDRIEVPMYFVTGFVEGAEKRFPNAEGDIATATRKTTHFLKSTGSKIKSIEDVRKANMDDPTQTDEAKAVNTWRYAEAKKKEIEETAQTLPDLSKYADGIRKRIDAEIRESADTNFGREARQRLAQMDEAERSKFISNAMSSGDYETPAFALGAPGYLSGLPEKTYTALKERYINDFYPAETELIKSLHSLHDHTQKGMKEYSKLMGKLHASASLGGALEKAEKAKKLMNIPAMVR